MSVLFVILFVEAVDSEFLVVSAGIESALFSLSILLFSVVSNFGCSATFLEFSFSTGSLISFLVAFLESSFLTGSLFSFSAYFCFAITWRSYHWERTSKN
nr:hypothetical protein [Mycoplasmopsis bovis]